MAERARRMATRGPSDQGVVMPLSASFETFFEEHKDRLFGVMFLMTANRQDAEELAQEAFLKMWERWDSVGRIADPGAYVYRIALNAFRKRVRRADISRRLTLRAPSSTPSASEDSLLLHEALRVLTPRQRAAIVLTELLGYSAIEASEALGVKPSTIGALKYQARAALKGGPADG
ncbi:MAG TPA: sigma-70 family RNA polymerase sigma factor [Actinomycetota bacterium]|nr:sigma-70 family RNA polymerase sigma factor [Actinomycetota bacterium]